MAQHDNGRRAGGTQSGTWQQGHRDQHDHADNQQDQASGGRYGAQQGGGQQGGHDQGGSRGHQDQYDSQRGQQGDNWQERQRAGGGQGGFGGQASDNDYGNRGVTESGNFGNYGSQRDRGNYGAPTGQNRGQGGAQTYGQSSADDYQGSRGWQGAPGNRDRYGDNGYQGNWQQGQRGQAYHDPDYHQWRSEQLARLDRDYDEWRQHRYQRFSEDFDNWRSNRDNNPATRASSQVGANAGQQSASGEVSGQQGGASKHDVSNGGDQGAGKTATK